jgi:hypothetical protein
MLDYAYLHRALVLTHRKFRELALEGAVEAEDDVLFGDTAIDQFERNAAFGAVVLNPDFAVFNVEV